MRVSTLFPLAVHSLVVISIFTGEADIPEDLKGSFPKQRVSSSFIAGSTGSNPVIIRGILGQLKRNGFIRVAKGRGGTSLDMPTRLITLWDVYSAVECTNIQEVFKIHPNASPFCPIGGNISCVLNPYFQKAFSAMESELLKVNIRDVTQDLFKQMQKHTEEGAPLCGAPQSAERSDPDDKAAL